eukprot:4407805-Alexandrium_andersonii.AAC.1
MDSSVAFRPMVGGICKIASGARNLNRAAPEETSKVAPEAPRGLRFSAGRSRRFRNCRRSEPSSPWKVPDNAQAH